MEAGRHTVTLIPWRKINNCTWRTETKSVRVKPSNAKHVLINNNTLKPNLYVVPIPSSYMIRIPDKDPEARRAKHSMAHSAVRT